MDSTRGKKIAIGCGCAFVIVLLLVLGGFWWMIDQSLGPSPGEVESDVRKLEKESEDSGFPELEFAATGAGTYASITYTLTDRHMDFRRYSELCTYIRDELGGGRNGSTFSAQGLETSYQGLNIEGCPHQAFGNLRALEEADLRHIEGINFTGESLSRGFSLEPWADITTSGCDLGDMDCARDMGKHATEVLEVFMKGQDASDAGEGDEQLGVQIESAVLPAVANTGEHRNGDREEEPFATVTLGGKLEELADASYNSPLVADLMAQNLNDVTAELQSGSSSEGNPQKTNQTAMRVDLSTKELQLEGIWLTNDVNRRHACERTIPNEPVYEKIARTHGLTNGLETLREMCKSTN